MELGGMIQGKPTVLGRTLSLRPHGSNPDFCSERQAKN